MLYVIGKLTVVSFITILFRATVSTATISTDGPVSPVQLYLDLVTGARVVVTVPLEPMQEVNFPVRASGFQGTDTFDTPADISRAVLIRGPEEADALLCQFFGWRFVDKEEEEKKGGGGQDEEGGGEEGEEEDIGREDDNGEYEDGEYEDGEYENGEYENEEYDDEEHDEEYGDEEYEDGNNENEESEGGKYDDGDEGWEDGDEGENQGVRIGAETTVNREITNRRPEQELREIAVSEHFQIGMPVFNLEGVTKVVCTAYFVEKQPPMQWD